MCFILGFEMLCKMWKYRFLSNFTRKRFLFAKILMQLSLNQIVSSIMEYKNWAHTQILWQKFNWVKSNEFMVNAVSDCLVLIAEKTCASIFGIYRRIVRWIIFLIHVHVCIMLFVEELNVLDIYICYYHFVVILLIKVCYSSIKSNPYHFLLFLLLLNPFLFFLVLKPPQCNLIKRYVTAWEIWRNPITGNMRVTLRASQ
jgi:hypothetical protein